MKKCLILIIIAAPLCLAQSRAVDKHGAMMAEGRPFVTDGGLYNNYDLDNSPLGLFDIDSSRFSSEAEYGYIGLGDFSRHDLSGWKVRMGEPGRAFFEVFYGPDFLFYKGAAAASLPLHRFGLTAAMQAAGGFFGAAVSVDGYTGTQTWENNVNARWLFGFEKLRLDMRSHVHPLVRVGVFGNAAVRIDTLYEPLTPNQTHEDFSTQVNLPELGGSVDFGGDGMPVRSNLSVSYAPSRFVYRSKNAGGGTPPVDSASRAPAIVNDSLQLFWMAQGRLPLGDDYAVKPGLLFGFSTNSGEMRHPSPDNYPFNLGGVMAEMAGSAYDLTALRFGVGGGFEALKYADVHAEYVNTSLSLKCNPAPAVESRALHHTALGVSTSLHEYIDMPLKVTPRVAYFISGTTGANGIAAPHWPDMGPLNIAQGKSKSYLYAPQSFLTGFTRVSGFTFGVDGSAFYDILSASLYVTFLSSKKDSDSKSGTEFGLSAGFKL